jgi:hypothetical protein
MRFAMYRATGGARGRRHRPIVKTILAFRRIIRYGPATSINSCMTVGLRPQARSSSKATASTSMTSNCFHL